MDEIVGDRFALSLLRGKLINISGELSPTLKRTDKIKLLTGEDPVFAQEKFKAGFSFIPYAKLIFMGNIVPSTPDSSAGFYRRTLILPFVNTIPPEKKDPQLLNKIKEEEIQGLLKKATLEILPPFIERGFRFSVDLSIDELERKWEDFSNPLRTFVEQYFEPAPGEKKFLPNSVLNQIYETYCQEKGFPRLNRGEFSNQMREEGFTPGLHRLSPSDIDRLQQMGFSASSPCRGWWCNGVTLVTDKFTLTK
jgi:putative DNA primase/helicase